MTTLDWLIVAATLLFAVNGYLRGFIVGALSLAGFVVGAIVGTRIADALLSGGQRVALRAGVRAARRGRRRRDPRARHGRGREPPAPRPAPAAAGPDRRRSPAPR